MQGQMPSAYGPITLPKWQLEITIPELSQPRYNNLAMPPEEIADRSLTSIQSRLIKTGARVVRHARKITFQLADYAKIHQPIEPFAHLNQ